MSGHYANLNTVNFNGPDTQ